MGLVDYAALPEFSMRPGILGKWISGIDRGSSSISVLWNDVDPGASVPKHFHAYEEVIMVEGGQIWVTLGEDTFDVVPGQVAIIPPDVVHAWGNAGASQARVLFIWPVLEPFAPGKSTYVEGAPPRVT
jgi:quercetin dioxygenase-like cupin family protein